MTTCLRWTSGAILALALVLPALTQETNKDTPTDKPAVEKKNEPPPKPKLIPAGKGVTNVVRADRTSITVKVNYKKPAIENNQLVLKDVSEDVTLQFTEDVKIRMPEPPEAFDEKGNFKKYTPKELDELKGPDKTLPGYTASWENLRPGQIVELRLVKRAGSSASLYPTPTRPTYPRPPNSKQPEPPPAEKPLVAIVVILRDPNQP
jgi:hypothetical protein